MSLVYAETGPIAVSDAIVVARTVAETGQRAGSVVADPVSRAGTVLLDVSGSPRAVNGWRVAPRVQIERGSQRHSNKGLASTVGQVDRPLGVRPDVRGLIKWVRKPHHVM